MSLFRRPAAILAAMLLAPIAIHGAARADDFTDQLDQAGKAYGNHDLRGAQKALGNAETLLRQQRLVQWKTVLPDALDGWKAEDIQGTAAAMAMLGGGVSVSRRYDRSPGSITIEIVADSPIVSSVMPMLKMLTAIGSETVVAGGTTAVYRKDDHSLMAVVDDKALVTVKGQNAPDDALKSYFKAIHFDTIATLLK